MQGLRDVDIPSDDDDLMNARFQKRQRSPDTRAPSAPGGHRAASASEDILKEFLEPELASHFQTGDAALFIKMVAAEGIDSCSQ